MTGSIGEAMTIASLFALKFMLAKEYGEELCADLTTWGKAYLEDKNLYQLVLDWLPREITHKFRVTNPLALLASDPKAPVFHVERFARRYQEILKEQPAHGIATAVAEYCDANALWTTPPASEADRQLLDQLYRASTGNAPDAHFAREALAALRIERANLHQVDARKFFERNLATRS